MAFIQSMLQGLSGGRSRHWTSSSKRSIGAEVDNVFFITTPDEAPILSETALACLSRKVHARLESKAANAPATKQT